MNSRPILTSDLPLLQLSIDNDVFHPGRWKLEDFQGFSELFEDKHGAIVYTHYTPEEGMSLRIETMWVSPDDKHRNARAIVFLVNQTAERARSVGFVNLCFTTEHPPLADFCTKVLYFKNTGGNEYVLPIGK